MTGKQVPVSIIGCGDIGRRVAIICQQAGQDVEAWVRSSASGKRCRSLDLRTHQMDLDRPADIESHPHTGRILYTVPPPRSGSHDPRIKTFLDALDERNVSRFVLISTSGVYGDCMGQWVDEKAAIHPVAERALRRADAETSLRRWAERKRINYLILRVPGIYATDRLPLRRLESGAPVVRRDQAPWTNRIHADDLAAVCYAALSRPVSNEIINVSDDAPSTMTDYFFTVADYAGLPRPPEISLDEVRESLSPGMLSYLSESRRIDNHKMKRLLSIELKYPSLKQGLYGTDSESG